MRKQLYTLGMLALLGLGTFVNAQETGRVGINAGNSPQATLDVQPSAANLTRTTNEGFIAPKLSKERIAKIAVPVEGTLVYATDATYSGSNVKVADITEKGYYFYNGNKWIKAGAGAGQKEIGAVYQKVRIFRGTAFNPTDFQADDYVIGFTRVTQVTLPSAENNKKRTLCLRNSTTAPFGGGAAPLTVNNVVADARTINPNLTRCYTSFQDTDGQWYWISTAF